eukprot:jgi/Bigna1/91796/estExt_fgenesh1_pg.C_1200006
MLMQQQLLIIVLGMLPAVVGGAPPLVLTRIDEDLAGRMGAYCLDGSLPGFWFAPAQSPEFNSSWIIYLQGGGFCATPGDCADRATGDLGSSNGWEDTQTLGGIMNDDPAINPAFSQFNRVHVGYCDGWFFASNREGTVTTPDGSQVKGMGLSSATELVLGGGSAGATATLKHADYLYNRYPGVKFGAVPVSGVFPLHPDFQGSMGFWDVVLQAQDFHNSTQAGMGGNKCLEVLKGDPMCGMPNYSYAFLEPPVFVFNSAVDLYALENIWKGDVDCVETGFQNCTSDAIDDINAWGYSFYDTISTSGPTFNKLGNGAFIDSCLEHCAPESTNAFTGITQDGVAMNAAVSSWWSSGFKEAADAHTYLPCPLNEQPPHLCNPTCDSVNQADLRGKHAYRTPLAVPGSSEDA